MKVNNNKIRLICWMCSKLKTNPVWHISGFFIVDFDCSQYINIVFLFLTLSKHLAIVCERQVIMFWEHKKLYICFLIKSPISSSNLLLHGIEINYEHMTILWTYNECMFQPNLAIGISSVLSSLFPRNLIFFAVSNQKPT